MSSAPPNVLIVGIESSMGDYIKSLTQSVQFVDSPMDPEKLMDDVLKPAPLAVFCGQPQNGISEIELAQLLRSTYQNAALYYVSTSREGFDRLLLIKNGFNDAFLLPLDNSLLKQAFLDQLANSSVLKESAYRRVSLIDLEPGSSLPFDLFVFLPLNRKHLRFSAAQEKLDPERVQRLKTKQTKSVAVKIDQMSAFHRYTAERLKALGRAGLSATERKAKCEYAVRELLSLMFTNASASDFDEGRGLAEDCHEIIKHYVLNDQEGKNGWYEKVLKTSGQDGQTYNHAANVATYAALFSLGLGIGKPEELAMAGLLHDIGLAEIPSHIQAKTESARTKTEQAVYANHALHSLNIIRERRLIISDRISRAILEHHERFSGTGYPKALPGHMICDEAQILAMADRFDELTAIEAGRQCYTPLAAIQFMCAENAKNLSVAQFKPDLLKKLARLFSIEHSNADTGKKEAV